MTRTTTTNRGRWPKVTLLVAVTAGVLLWWAVPAFAHVEAAGSEGTNGATTVTFSFAHGCTGSPTTGLRIQLPEGTTNVQATPHDGFNSNASNAELSWTGGNVPDSQSAEFTASMVLLGTVGETVFFPTIQTCVTGEESWIEKTDDPEAENAAPRIQLPVAGPTTTTTSTTEPTTTTTAATTTTTAATTTTTAATTTSTTRAGTTVPVQSTSDSGPPWLWIILIIAAAVGAAIVGLLLYQRSQADKPPADGDNPPTDPGVPPTAPPGGAPSGTTAPATPPAATPPAPGPADTPPTVAQPPAGEPPTVAQPPTEPWGTGGTGGTPPA